ncbi:MAG: FtsX-like permease family protein [Rikenellaceae bacterium]|nr:FtsX-like permease family protein [Rikenellaceae bacterium]
MFWRNFITLLRRYTASSLLNIVGMAIAFAAVYLIAVQVKFDLSYNRVIKNSERIYRLEYPNEAGSGRWEHTWNRQYPDNLVASCPEVEAAGSLNIDVYVSQREYSHKRNATIENITLEIAGAERDGLEVFPFEWVAGGIEDFIDVVDNSSASVLVISESAAKRYNLEVGDGLHIGRGATSNGIRTIVGIYKDFSKPSSLAHLDGWYNLSHQATTSENNWTDPYYIRLQEGASVEAVEKQMLDFVIEDNRKSGLSEEDIANIIDRAQPRLTPIADLYFIEDAQPEWYHGSRTTTYTLIAIAVLILVISFINFINFFFALIPSRIRAVNNYKIFGAPTAKLRLNFLFETVGLILVSLFGAAVIVVLFADTPLKEYISTSVAIDENWLLAGAIALGVILFGVVVSLYPAWYITKFSPAFVIKGDFSASKSGRILRYTLVGIQFTISITLIICSLFIYRQHQYMLSRDMGFDKENLLTVDVPYESISKFSMSGVEQTRRNAFIDKLKENPQIKDVAFGSGVMVSDANLDGNFQTVSDDGSLITFTSYPVSYNFLEVMGIVIVDGRNFSPSDEASETGALIFNQNASRNFGLTTDMSLYGHLHQQKTNIVGICEDFDFLSAQHSVAPFAFVVYGKRVYTFPCHAYIRTVAGADIAAVRKYIFDTIMEFAPNADPEKVEVKFFDNELELVYQREDKLSTLVTLFSFLSIVISIIGVFGLVLFETQYRRREIAIRRVYGASFSGILTLFNLKYVCIVAICSAIAIPISYYVIDNWMQQYVYRIPMSWWVYAVAVAIILAITLITVTLRSWKAATENPADVVKSN